LLLSFSFFFFVSFHIFSSHFNFFFHPVYTSSIHLFPFNFRIKPIFFSSNLNIYPNALPLPLSNSNLRVTTPQSHFLFLQHYKNNILIPFIFLLIFYFEYLFSSSFLYSFSFVWFRPKYLTMKRGTRVCGSNGTSLDEGKGNT